MIKINKKLNRADGGSVAAGSLIDSKIGLGNTEIV